jgi:hypothetical protein
MEIKKQAGRCAETVGLLYFRKDAENESWKPWQRVVQFAGIQEREEAGLTPGLALFSLLISTHSPAPH